MLDVPIGMFIVGFVVGLTIAAVYVFRSWERDVTSLRRHLAREAIDNLELRDENAELRRALTLRVGHPSVSLRPLAPVIDFPQRGGA